MNMVPLIHKPGLALSLPSFRLPRSLAPPVIWCSPRRPFIATATMCAHGSHIPLISCTTCDIWTQAPRGVGVDKGRYTRSRARSKTNAVEAAAMDEELERSHPENPIQLQSQVMATIQVSLLQRWKREWPASVTTSVESASDQHE